MSEMEIAILLGVFLGAPIVFIFITKGASVEDTLKYFRKDYINPWKAARRDANSSKVRMLATPFVFIVMLILYTIGDTALLILMGVWIPVMITNLLKLIKWVIFKPDPIEPPEEESTSTDHVSNM